MRLSARSWLWAVAAGMTFSAVAMANFKQGGHPTSRPERLVDYLATPSGTAGPCLGLMQNPPEILDGFQCIVDKDNQQLPRPF